MKRFWRFSEWLPYQFDGDLFLEHSRVLNNDDVSRAGALFTRDFRHDPFPVVELQLTLPDFDVDCFLYNMLAYVSERMRDAMDLQPNEIQYFDVDASYLAPLPRSKKYKVMNIPIVEDISDPASSNYEMRRLAPNTPELPVLVQEIAIRPDAEPTHQLFYDKFFRGYIFCTDALAMRVLRARCTGIGFLVQVG